MSGTTVPNEAAVAASTTNKAASVQVSMSSASSASSASDNKKKLQFAELEAKAVAEATASADDSYVPSPSLLNAATANDLLKQVDGANLDKFVGKDSVYSGRNVPISLRSKLDIPIHVVAPGSIVEYSVNTQNYDLGFGITAEREEGITIVKESARVESHKSTVTGKFLVGAVPCMLVFSFDNEFSWFREKQLSYRITVTPPQPTVIMAGRRRRAKACQKIVQEDRTSACRRLEKATNQKATLQGGIQKMQKALEELTKSLDVVETEEKWLSARVELRKDQEHLLEKRLTEGWDDEPE